MLGINIMRFLQELPKQFQSKNAPNSAKNLFIKSVQKGSKTGIEQSTDERYQEIYNAKLTDMRNKALKGAKYTFALPGTDPASCRELSKGAQEIIAKIADKKAKRAEKKMSKADVVRITPKAFTGTQGGRIDNKGYIYDSAGQWIMTVDKKTGKIKNRRNGCTVGKYNSGCSYSEHRLCELISQHDTSKKAGWYAGSKAHGSAMPGENSIWGKESGSVGTGSIWGTGGGNIWGHSENKDGNNGWW
jgi:hypothetical protein